MGIYSIGYEDMPRETVLRWLNWVSASAVLVDVRSSAKGPRVKRGFRRDELSSVLGARYEWRGDALGGRGAGPTADGLSALARETRDVVLMCQERSPGACHRHTRIAIALPGLVVHHVYPVDDGASEAEIVCATELAASVRECRAYAFTAAFL